MEIRLHSEVLGQRTTNAAAAAFVDVTLPVLSMPTSVKARPAAEMFQRRYDYFEGRYAWADSL